MAGTLNPYQLEAMLKKQAPAPLYLVVGEEDLLRDYAVAAFKAALLNDGGGFNYDLFYGDEATGADIRNCVSELPAFADRRLVVVKAAEKLPVQETEPLIDCLNQPVETTTLVFVSAKLDGRLKFSQLLARKAMKVDCSPLREPQLSGWIAKEAGKLGLCLDEEALHLLKDMAGGSLQGLRRELEKLAAYTLSSRSATAEDVQLLRGIEPGASIFDLTLAIAEGRRGWALSILARNLEAGEDPLRLLGSLAWQYRRIWKAKESLAAGNRETEVARTLQLRIEPARIRSFLARFSPEHTPIVSRLLFEANDRLKGGGSSRPRIVLERLVLCLCELATTAQPRSPVFSADRSGSRLVSNVRTIRSVSRTTR
ncbi:MAG: DNA polymerase III subunit delta [Nitrospira sp.]|nr:DNA polymerase III subunit delta [Nitrospira sp.]